MRLQGKTLQGDPTYAIDIPALCACSGREKCYEINAFDLLLLEKRSKKRWQRDEVSVIITKTPCVLLDKRKSRFILYMRISAKMWNVHEAGMSGNDENPDGTIHIDDTMCTGCGLCKDLCKFDAIELIKEGE